MQRKHPMIAEELRNQFDRKQDKTSDLRHFVPNEQCHNKFSSPN